MSHSEYNRDQLETLRMIRDHLKSLPQDSIKQLKSGVEPYLRFRSDVSDFQSRNLSGICTAKCFTDNTSACCSREGIATFFADAVINALYSPPDLLDAIERLLVSDRGGFKCVYLADDGCIWHLKPIVCEMFLCDHAKDALAAEDDSLMTEWEILKKREKRYTWPDKPVLFDYLEKFFMEAGMDSPLMYFHRSPGLLRVKAGFRKKQRSE